MEKSKTKKKVNFKVLFESENRPGRANDGKIAGNLRHTAEHAQQEESEWKERALYAEKRTKELLEVLQKYLSLDFSQKITVSKEADKWDEIATGVNKLSEVLENQVNQAKEINEELQTMRLEMEGFSYSVSHDLRAPLRAINGYAKILLEDNAVKLDEEGIKPIHIIIKNTKKMGEFIDDLLAFSRLGRKQVSVSDINMTALVNSLKKEALFDHSTQNIEFKFNELIPAKGDPGLIKRVWTNLISNAIKYSQHKPKINIEIGSYHKDKHVVYYVKDEGVGFDMKYYDKLFGVFQQLHSGEEYKGTGIGLAIAQRIVQRHNGTIWAESKLNEGTCFYFSLPDIDS
jgi:light-regulated signal transduction histidine kinase (bacteriophytochrome)